MRKPPTAKQMEQEVSVFNSKIKIGDDVAVTIDDGSVTFDRTKSEAFILSGHTPVVFLEKLGTYLLNRVRKVRQAAA